MDSLRSEIRDSEAVSLNENVAPAPQCYTLDSGKQKRIKLGHPKYPFNIFSQFLAHFIEDIGRQDQGLMCPYPQNPEKQVSPFLGSSYDSTETFRMDSLLSVMRDLEAAFLNENVALDQPKYRNGKNIFSQFLAHFIRDRGRQDLGLLYPYQQNPEVQVNITQTFRMDSLLSELRNLEAAFLNKNVAPAPLYYPLNSKNRKRVRLDQPKYRDSIKFFRVICKHCTEDIGRLNGGSCYMYKRNPKEPVSPFSDSSYDSTQTFRMDSLRSKIRDLEMASSKKTVAPAPQFYMAFMKDRFRTKISHLSRHYFIKNIRRPNRGLLYPYKRSPEKQNVQASPSLDSSYNSTQTSRLDSLLSKMSDLRAAPLNENVALAPQSYTLDSENGNVSNWTNRYIESGSKFLPLEDEPFFDDTFHLVQLPKYLDGGFQLGSVFGEEDKLERSP